MNIKEAFYRTNQVGIGLGVVLLSTLAGCTTGQTGHPHVAAVYETPPVVVIQDDYVYYPDYQVYFNNTRHEYVYQDDGAWISRPAPPNIAAAALRASPSEKLERGDFPAHHRSVMIVRQNPGNGAPPGIDQGQDKTETVVGTLKMRKDTSALPQ